MSWDSWLRTWAAHAKTRRFARMLDRAKRICVDTASGKRLFCSLSGGKDSGAMAGVIAEAGLLDDVPMVHAHSALNFPDTLEVVNATAEILDADLEIIEPDGLDDHVRDICKRFGTPPPQPSIHGYDELDLLRCFPGAIDITDAMSRVYNVCSAGNQLVAHTYAEGFDGSYVGIRAAESKGRRAFAKYRGTSHQHVTDGKWVFAPLIHWSSDDVMAMLVSRELPIHPYYRRAWEAFPAAAAGSPADMRVDLMIVGGYAGSHGAHALIARVYPEMWRRLCAIRPELRRYA